MEKHHQFIQFSLFRAPGFPSHTFPNPSKFHNGLNVVYGPNGVGKTTLVRALRSLLHTTEQQKNVEAEATLLSGEQSWHLSLSQGKLVQKRLESGEVTRLAGRNDEFAEAYWLALHELLAQESSSEVFVQAVQREMQGGIDLQKALTQSGGISFFSNGRIQLAKRVKEAYELYKQATDELLANVNLQEEIRDLQAKLLALPVLQQQLIHQKNIEAYLKQQHERSLILQKLSTYDSRLELLTEHSLDDEQALRVASEQAIQAVADIKSSIEKDEDVCKAYHIDQALLEQEQLPLIIGKRIEAIRELESRLRTAQKDEAESDAALKSWEENLAWLISDLPKQAGLKQMVETLTKLAHACEPLRCTLSAREQHLQSLGEEVILSSKENQALEALRNEALFSLRTLVELDGMEKTKPILRWALIGGVFALSLTGSLLGHLINPAYSLAGTVLSAAFVFLLTRTLPNPAYQSKESTLKAAHEQLKKHLDSFFLDSFDVGSVSHLLVAVESRMAEIKQLEAENARRRAVKQAHQDAREAYGSWLVNWKDASEALHLTIQPNLEESQFFHFSSHLHEWTALAADKARSAASRSAVEAEYRQALKDLGSLCLLEEHHTVDLLAKAGQLALDLRLMAAVRERLEHSNKQLETAQTKLAQAQENLQAFNDRLKLDNGDLISLEHLQELYGEYHLLQDQRRAVELLIAGFSEQVQNDAAELTVEMAARAVMQTEGALERLQLVMQDAAKKQERFAMLSKDTKLEEALLTYEEAKDALEAQRAKEVQERMVFSLFEEVKQQTESTYVPQVIKRASDWLLRITANRFSLGMSQGTFTALDTTLDRSFSLSELSSGTRVQLLFAVRMAFLEMLESGSEYHFPIFFDELMANSDDQRSLSIAQAIVEISKDRQVFYCTAQMDEVSKLTQVAQNDLQVIRLEDEKRKYRLQENPFTAVKVDQKPCLEPIEEYEEYGRALGVLAPLLHEPVGSLNSWYLATESNELHALLLRGFIHAGQAAGAGEPYQGRLDLLAEAQALALIGRPRRLSIHDLSVDDLKLNRNAAYYENLQVFLQDGGRTGNDVLQGIENKTIKSFSTSAKDTLTTYLYEKGFASDQVPYSLPEILNQLCLAHPTLRVDSGEYGIIQRYLQSLDIEN